MIRGVIKEGVIQPLDPLPHDWREGQRVKVEVTADFEPSSDPGESGRWYEEMEAMADSVSQEDIDRMNRAIAEADEQAKAFVRRQMGLS